MRKKKIERDGEVRYRESHRTRERKKERDAQLKR
jgi:hypothetical protein